ILHQETKAALYGMKNVPPVFGYLAGVGGVNVSPQKIEEMVRSALRAAECPVKSIWAGDE
ncbi:MAG: pyruvate ferredoxin oxidoreductase, partial [Firmicutes bacterium]|nr:pyruvate ferredoxin oxidoreductase [Bacillota bacterium]